MIETDIDFPANLPCAVRDGYDINHVQPFTRTKMDSGRGRPRRKFTSVPSDVNVTWMFNDTQSALFERWFADTISDGTDWFNSDIRTPLGLGKYVCRFIEMYRGPHLIGTSRWRFTAFLEILERPLIDRDWLLLPDYLANSEIFDWAMNREWPQA